MLVIFLYALTHIGIEKPATKGKDLYDSVFTTLVEFCVLDNQNRVFFTANVEASMVSQVYYPQVCIDMENGQITTSKCTCEASETGTCTHVSCLLNVLLDVSKRKEPKIVHPGTSKTQS